MPATDLPFSPEEYQSRLARTREVMASNGLDALYLSDPSNMAWLTGYDGWSFYVHQGVVVLPDGDPVWWGRGIDRNGALRTVWMGEDRVFGYGDDYVQSTTSHPMQDLAMTFSKLGIGSGRIGVELDNYYFSARAMHTLNASLPKASWTDATGTVNRLRAVKSAAEIGLRSHSTSIMACSASLIRSPGPLLRLAIPASSFRHAWCDDYVCSRNDYDCKPAPWINIGQTRLLLDQRHITLDR